MTDTFEVTSSGRGKLSMQSILSDAHNTMGIELPSSTDVSIGMADRRVNSTLAGSSNRLLQLPSPERLDELLQIFFNEHNPFFPCVDRRYLEEDLLEWLATEGYGTQCTAVQVAPTHAPLGANLCMVLAVADFVNPQRWSTADVSFEEEVPGRHWHEKGLLLLDRFFPSRSQEIDIVRFHLLESMYLVYLEQLRQASKSLGLAIQLAFRTELHDQSSWPDLTPTQSDSRRVLFWSLYYMDRRLSEKCGQPYLIRDDEVDMSEFSTDVHDNADVSINGHDEPESLNRALRAYIQHLIDWSRLWTDIWDTFFSVRARKATRDREHDRSTLNAKIDLMFKNLPSELIWDRDRLLQRSEGYEDERHARFRLLALTVSAKRNSLPPPL